MFFSSKPTTVPAAVECLPGRGTAIPTARDAFCKWSPVARTNPARDGTGHVRYGGAFGVWSACFGVWMVFG